MIRRTAITALAVLALTGCDTRPAPSRGTVTDAEYTAAWMQFIPGQPPQQTCTGGYGTQPRTCTTIPGTTPQWIPWPESFKLTITDLNDKEWSSDIDIDKTDYERCNLGEIWPDCTDERAGDVRPS